MVKFGEKKSTVENEKNKINWEGEWYKSGWGLVIAILFLPIFIVWYVWAKSKLSQVWKIVITVIIGIMFISALANEPKTTTTTIPVETPKTTETPKPTEQPKAEEPKPVETPTPVPIKTTAPTPAPAPTPPPAPQADNQNIPPVSSETISQKNAVQKAKSYLDYTAFSHDGLVAQLEYEQFSHVDAVYGADNSGANWNEQAAKSAKQYMEYTAFSRGSLIEQLKYGKFTQEQAVYGANAVGL